MSDELKKKRLELIKRIVCIALVVIFLPILIINIVLIVKGLANPKTPPGIFGCMPLVVSSGSMDDGSAGCIKKDDLIFVVKVDPQTLKEGDIITFISSEDKEHNKYEFTTHRIINVVTKGDEIYFETKGDANNVSDGLQSAKKVIGVYRGKIGGLGGFVMFLQTPMGMLIFAGIPIAIFVILEVMSYLNNKKKAVSAAALDEKDAEIERLKALIEKNGGENAELDELEETEETQEAEEPDKPEEVEEPTENSDDSETTETEETEKTE